MERIEPGPGQESVWDYPRPPRLDPSMAHVTVTFADRVIADTRRAVRVLETSQAPAFYIPPDDIDSSVLTNSTTSTFCEWKGRASYVNLVVGDRVAPDAGWRYLDPTPRFADITGWIAFYAARVDRCTVDHDVVSPNDGDFYGGWITPSVVGPFKGGPGTVGW